jgi:hypothetical protein
MSAGERQGTGGGGALNREKQEALLNKDWELVVAKAQASLRTPRQQSFFEIAFKTV